jgi:hypothetical protein
MFLLVGDSHSNNMYLSKPFKHLLCSAGSAKGLNNLTSNSQYRNIILEEVAKNNYTGFIFNFGAVDVDFSFIHKFMDNPHLSYHDFNREVVGHYLKYIVDFFSDKLVFVNSVGLPTLDDAHLKSGLLNAHINHLENYDIGLLQDKLAKEMNLPNVHLRSQMVINFNEELKKRIRELNILNIIFMDTTTFSYDPTKMRIRDEYFTRNDHHNYSRNRYIVEIINHHLNSVE